MNSKFIPTLIIIILFTSGCAKEIQPIEDLKTKESLILENISNDEQKNETKINTLENLTTNQEEIKNRTTTECDSWSFFRGKCAPELSYCKINGYGLKNLSRNEGWFRGAICLSENGTELGNVVDLMNLEYKPVDMSGVYCIKLGYKMKIVTEDDGGQYGVCVFSEKTNTTIEEFPEIMDCIVAIQVDYDSGIVVNKNNDVEQVFNNYISWAKENNENIMGHGNNWKFENAKIHGLYQGIKYWKVTASYFSEEDYKWITKTVFDVSENGDVVRLLGCI